MPWMALLGPLGSVAWSFVWLGQGFLGATQEELENPGYRDTKWDTLLTAMLESSPKPQLPAHIPRQKPEATNVPSHRHLAFAWDRRVLSWTKSSHLLSERKYCKPCILFELTQRAHHIKLARAQRPPNAACQPDVHYSPGG